jgi:hypothetical protein
VRWKKPQEQAGMEKRGKVVMVVLVIVGLVFAMGLKPKF